MSKSVIINMDGLSHRAQKVAQSSAGSLMWEVMRDPWSPSTNPCGYVNIGVAENFLMHDQLLHFVNTTLRLPDKYLTYNDGGGGSLRLRTAIAHFLTRHLQPVTPLKPSDVVVTNGVSSAIEHISWLLADPGEGILLGRPYYGTFIPDLSLRFKSAVVPVAFDGCDPFSVAAVACYETALHDFQQRTGHRVKALMLCHPHNPLGRCYPREVLVALLRLCQKHQIHLVSDEIYALSVWTNTVDNNTPANLQGSSIQDCPRPVDFQSILSIDLTGVIDPSLVHVLWGMSKDFGANGLRLGAVISQSNRALHQALDGTSIYSYPSGVSDHLTAEILEDSVFTDRYIQLNRARLAESYAFVAGFLRDHGIEYAPGANAGFFLWVNLGRKYLERRPEEEKKEEEGSLDEVVMELLLQKRVFLASGVLFGSERPGWFRIVFSHHRDYLSEALQRIVDAIED